VLSVLPAERRGGGGKEGRKTSACHWNAAEKKKKKKTTTNSTTCFFRVWPWGEGRGKKSARDDRSRIFKKGEKEKRGHQPGAGCRQLHRNRKGEKTKLTGRRRLRCAWRLLSLSGKKKERGKRGGDLPALSTLPRKEVKETAEPHQLGIEKTDGGANLLHQKRRERKRKKRKKEGATPLGALR